MEQKVDATEDIPTGENLILSASFDKDGEDPPRVATGILSLYHGDKKVGEGQDQDAGGVFALAGEGLCVGRDSGEAVTDDYPGEAPYAFTGGTIKRVAVDVSGEPYLDLERQAVSDARARVAFGRERDPRKKSTSWRSEAARRAARAGRPDRRGVRGESSRSSGSVRRLEGSSGTSIAIADRRVASSRKAERGGGISWTTDHESDQTLPAGADEAGSGATRVPRSERGRESPHPRSSRTSHPQERKARGKAARNEVPLESHAVFAPEARLDPIDLLEEQAKTRVPELVPIRYGRMGVSPFTFYRGAALIMAADLAGTPTSGLHAQLCGDAHLSNFGLYGSPERHMVFDINDFDETSVGPWEWDVKRLAASLEIGGRAVGFTDKERRAAVLAGVREYRTAMRSFAAMTNLEVWYAHIDIEERLPELKAQVAPERAKMLDKALAKMKTRDSMQAFTKLTEQVDGAPRILSQPPLIVPLRELIDDEERLEGLEQEIAGILRSYRRTLETDRRHLLEEFRIVEIARKVVGVGSVGTRAWIALMLGRDEQDPLFLQVKEAEESVLERFAGRSEYANHGQRVVAGQRLMQASSDIFLGWDRVTGIDGQQRDFYFRQFRDWKGSIEIDTLLPLGLAIYARLCGWTLARAHARSGDRIAIAAYMGKSDAFDQAIAAFSVAYADQNERDYQAMQAAVEQGRITAEVGL